VALAAIACTVGVEDGTCETCVAALDSLPAAAAGAAPTDPAGVAAVGFGGVGVGGGVAPESGTIGAPECEDSADWLIGPEMLMPATTDIAAAATAPEAMMRLRTKYNRGDTTAAGTTAGGGAGGSGSGWPKVRDAKTSSKVACSSATARSGLGPLMILHYIVGQTGPLDTRSRALEFQTPPHVQGYSDQSHAHTREPRICQELV
jgi:hypothetical protein